MAPRYTDPITVYDYNDDDDTSLSDLSNSSKSDISDDLKWNMNNLLIEMCEYFFLDFQCV